MKFDGIVGDMKGGEESRVSYVQRWKVRGDMKKFERKVKMDMRRKGLCVSSIMSNDLGDGVHEVVVSVVSGRGIV